MTIKRGQFRLRAQGRGEEAAIQERVAAMLRAYMPTEVWWTASLSGVPLSPPVAAAAKRAGMQKGAPDLSFIFPDGRSRYIELKTPTGTLTPEQAMLQERLGPRMAVCRSWPEVRDVLIVWLRSYGLRLLTDKESVMREGAARQAALAEQMAKARPMRRRVARASV